MKILSALQARLNRFSELEQLLTDPKILVDAKQVRELAKELTSLRPLVNGHREWQRIQDQIKSTQEMLHAAETSEEIRSLARTEIADLQKQSSDVERRLEDLLYEADPEDEKSAIMEIRAGTGGAEATLFASDLYRMYTRYAARKGWKIEPLGMSATEVGGFKEMIFGIDGTGVFRELKFERGVHRVQRVPETEASGRIHTSTVTVAVLPQAEDVDIQIEAKDLRIDVFRSSGPGGQGVNTTDSAVRITHLLSGIVVSCQDERSQLKNKAKAMKVLRARLMDHKREEQQAKRTIERRAQIGTGDRSEKIRTYNFPDRRITEHRIGLTSHKLEAVLNGELEELIGPLLSAERQTRLGNKK